MSDYTKTGLLFLMIAVPISICGALVSYAYYSTINLFDLEGALSSMFFMLLPIAVIGGLGGLITFIGGVFMFLGRKEFGPRHQKNIFNCIILLIVFVGTVVLLSFFNVFLNINLISMSFTQNTVTFPPDFYMKQMIFSLLQLFLISLFSGLLWVLGLYYLEPKKGRTILLATLFMLLLTPVVTSIGSYSTFNEFTTQDSFTGLNNTSAATYSTMLLMYQWKGMTGVILLLVSWVSYLLIFVALYLAYKNIMVGKLHLPLPSEELYHQ
jgi:hypothetical protein